MCTCWGHMVASICVMAGPGSTGQSTIHCTEQNIAREGAAGKTHGGIA